MASEKRRVAHDKAVCYLVTRPRLVHVWYLPCWKGFPSDRVVAVTVDRGIGRRRTGTEGIYASAEETIFRKQRRSIAKRRLMGGRLVSLLFFVLLVYLARLLQRNREALKAAS